MAEVLVVVEASQSAGVKKVTLEMLTIARALGDVSAVVFGGSGAADSLKGKLGEFGASKIYAAEGDDIDGYLVAPKATVLAELVRRVSPAAVLLGSTQEGKEIAGRLAVKLDNGLLTDAVELDADGKPTAVAGVPPDYFSADGQLWGNPLYRWPAHIAENFAWWIARLKGTTDRVDLLRLDHFRGFEAYWEVPAGSETAATGRWALGPGTSFLEALREGLGGLPVVNSELSTIQGVYAGRRHAKS